MHKIQKEHIPELAETLSKAIAEANKEKKVKFCLRVKSADRDSLVGLFSGWSGHVKTKRSAMRFAAYDEQDAHAISERLSIEGITYEPVFFRNKK